MEDDIFHVPVNCPTCAEERLCSLSTAITAKTLLKGLELVLKCPCRARWIATATEREQLREYLGALKPELESLTLRRVG
jgi:hypothetical protein